jgi:hypothetical protein
MEDSTEQFRREEQARLNAQATLRAELEKQYGQVWDTTQLQQDFEVVGFMAPFVEVKRKSDGKRGSLTFQHSPRFYFDFVEA